jgi:hypothetical protein
MLQNYDNALSDSYYDKKDSGNAIISGPITFNLSFC